MERLTVCRICLVDNVRMHEVTDRYLQETYEKITNIQFDTDLRPLLACFICHSRLKNCHQFMIKCLEAEDLFSQIISEDSKLKPLKLEGIDTSNGLTIASIQQINITEIFETAVKKEIPVQFERNDGHLKQEHIDEFHSEPTEHSPDEVEDNQPSDSEDDIPLTKIKTEVQPKKKRIRVKFKKNHKLDAHEIILSKEQQIENLVARSKSMNYNNSPYKCDICYKGFVDSRAYDNHKIRHDECSGSHICDICRMRYPTTQQLRTHTITAHARLFKCNKCGEVTHTASQARIHEKWHYGHTYECRLCSHTFRKPTSYLTHVRKQHPTENVCNICGESFVGKHGLQMHKSLAHKNDEMVENAEEPASDRFCSECNIQFSSLEAWKRHILCSIKHTLRKEHSSQCSICGHRCVGNAALATHMREHARSLKHRHQKRVGDTHLRCECQQCGSNFENRSKLQAHINRTHLGLKYNKNIVCEVCGKKCTSNATLKYHQRTHTGERPYPCGSCSKHFSDSNQLRIHTRTHTGEKPYVCTSCGKRFTQKPALNRHYRVHTGIKPYTCQYCSRTFSQSNSLNLHVKTVHLKQPPNTRKKTQEKKQEDRIPQEMQAVIT